MWHIKKKAIISFSVLRVKAFQKYALLIYYYGGIGRWLATFQLFIIPNCWSEPISRSYILTGHPLCGYLSLYWDTFALCLAHAGVRSQEQTEPRLETAEVGNRIPSARSHKALPVVKEFKPDTVKSCSWPVPGELGWKGSMSIYSYSCAKSRRFVPLMFQ